MTPQGFANLMGTMWPELIDAMPFGMGPMMRAMGKIPGALNLMKPMFPVLFPALAAHDDAESNAGYARECCRTNSHAGLYAGADAGADAESYGQLMPHMIGDLVPLVTQPMIDYLTGKL